MIDPLKDFNWSSLYEQYDNRCRNFDPASDHLKAIAPSPKSDRELYYHLVRSIQPSTEGREFSADLYEAMLYWKLYSNYQAIGNLRRWLAPEVLPSQTANLMRLLDELPSQIERNVGQVVNLVNKMDEYRLVGMKTPTALPVRTTFLHYFFPDVVPIFDKMVLRAVDVTVPNANHKIEVFQEYLPFAWELADRHAANLRGHYRESSIRLIDMALWIVR